MVLPSRPGEQTHSGGAHLSAHSAGFEGEDAQAGLSETRVSLASSRPTRGAHRAAGRPADAHSAALHPRPGGAPSAAPISSSGMAACTAQGGGATKIRGQVPPLLPHTTEVISLLEGEV